MANVAINVEVRANGEVVLGKLGAEFDALGKKADKAKTQMQQFAESFKQGVGIGAGFSVAAAAAEGLIGAYGKATQAVGAFARAIVDLSARAEAIQNKGIMTGMGTDAVQVFERLAENAGISGEKVFVAVSRMQRAAVEGGKGFRQLGIDAQAFLGQSTQDQLTTVAEKIMALPTAAERASAAMGVFGRAGAELLPVLAELARGASDVAVTMSEEQVAALAETDAALDKLGGAWTDFQNQVLASIASSPEVRQAIIDIADGVSTLARVIKENQATFKFFFDVFAGNALKGAGAIVKNYADQIELLSPGMPGARGNTRASIGATNAAMSGAGSASADPFALWKEMDRSDGTIGKQISGADDQIRRAETVEKLLYDARLRVRQDFQKEAERLYEWDNKAFLRSLDKKEEAQERAETIEKLLRDSRIRVAKEVEGELGRINQASTLIFMQEMEKRAEAARKAAEETAARWQNALQGIALLAGAIGGDLGNTLQVMGNIGQSFKGWSEMNGQQRFGAIAGSVGQIGGLVGGRAGNMMQGAAGGAMTGLALGGPVGAVVGGAIGAIGGLFGHNKAEEERKRREQEERLQQMDQMTKGLIEQYGSLAEADRMAHKYGVSLKEALDTKNPKLLGEALDMVNAKMKGMQMASSGLKLLMDNLTFKDEKGRVQSTFTDPKMLGAVARSFSATFWEVWRTQGAAAALELKPQFDTMMEELAKNGVDAGALGLGRVSRLMNVASDPRTAALLNVSRGAGQMTRGMMEAGYLDKGLLADQETIARETLAQLKNQGMDDTLAAQATADQLAALAQAYAATGQQMPEDLKAAMAAAGIEVLPTQLQVMQESRDYLKVIAGREGYAEGGFVNAKAEGEWYPLHGREYVIPERDYQAMRRSDFMAGRRVGGGGGLTVNLPPAEAGVLATARDRRQLAEFQARTNVRQIRRDAQVRRALDNRNYR
jgi:hypothetical protein